MKKRKIIPITSICTKFDGVDPHNLSHNVTKRDMNQLDIIGRKTLIGPPCGPLILFIF